MTCMTPRADAEETMPLLKPLSCQAMAAASDAGTPSCAAMPATCDDVRRAAVGCGEAVAATGTTAPAVVVAPWPARAGEPVGSLSTRPATSGAPAARPFA